MPQKKMKLGLKNTLKQSGSVKKVKKDISKIEAIAKDIQAEKVPAKFPDPIVKPEVTVKISVITPKSLHKKLRSAAYDAEVTQQEFILNLIREALG